jgi:hypothetical protein
MSEEFLYVLQIVIFSGTTSIHRTSELNSVALVRKVTIPTKRSPLVGEVSVNFCGYRVSRGQRNGSPCPLTSIFYTTTELVSQSEFVGIVVNIRLVSTCLSKLIKKLTENATEGT